MRLGLSIAIIKNKTYNTYNHTKYDYDYDYDYEIDLFGHIKKTTIRYISNRIYTLLNEMSN